MDLATLCMPTSDAARQIISEARTRTRSARKGGIQGLALRRTDVLHISPFEIRIQEGFNGRDFSDPANQEHVLSLADQIEAEGGIRQPLTVYMKDGAPHLEHGECRLRATFILINERNVSIPTVPVRVSKSEDEAERVAGMLMDNSGKPFSTLETAGVINRLLAQGKTLEWLARRTGYTLNRLKQLVEISALPEPVREQVAHGTVSATEAVRVVRQHGDEAPAIIEQAAALSSENGGEKAGRATRATLEAVAGAPSAPETREDDGGSPPVAPLTCSGLLRVLEAAVAIQEGEQIAVYVSVEDWERITALF